MTQMVTPRAVDSPQPGKTWHCGTLLYTRAGIVTLFVFLLWGSFSFNLMMTVIPSILPLKLKDLGASNAMIGLLITSVFPIFGIFISPYLSFKSDHLRTRWGRRIPFFVATLPLVTLSIFLLAFSEDIAAYFHRCGLLASLSPETATICVMGVCIVTFQLSDVLVSSIYIYIFNDTVPVALIGRFVGLMQIVGGGIGFLYNYFIFKYAESNMKEIFIGTGIVYFLGIGMMCLFVKEGKYPQVTEEEKKQVRGISGLKTYFRECFSHRFYWFKFLYSTAPVLTWMALGPFDIFFLKEMGLTLDYVGKGAAITAVAGMIAAYFCSVFIDRWHPLRIIAYSAVFGACFSFGGWVWLFVTIPPAAFFYFNILGGGLIGLVHGALLGLTSMPFDIRLLPKSRYGQFCSAQSIVGNGCKVIAGVAAGLYFDFFKWIFHGSDYAYRFNFIWSTCASIFLAWVVCSLYRQWKALGGDLHFHPPAPWSPTGYEEMEQTPFVGAQTRWLNHALNAMHLMMLFNLLYTGLVTYWLWRIHWITELRLYLLFVTPGLALIYFFWIKVERAIKADVKRCLAGLAVRDGIPHHGIFFVKACTMLIGSGFGTGMTIVCFRNDLHNAIFVFGISGVLSNAMAIVAVLILRRLERGYDPLLNYDGRKVEEALPQPV